MSASINGERIRALFDVRRITSRGFARNIFVLALGTLLGNGLVALVSPILTRLYAPADLGRVGVYTSFINIASTATALRYELAIVSGESVEEAAMLAFGSLLIAGPTSALLGVALYGLIHWRLLGFQVLPTWAALAAPMSLFTATAFVAFRYWFIRAAEFGVVSRAFVGQNVVRASIQIGAGFLRTGWTGLFAGDLLGRSASAAALARRALPSLVPIVRRSNRAALRSAFRNHREFPLVSLPSTLLDMLALNLPLPFVVHYFGVDAGGQFSLVQLVFALPLSLIGGSIGDAFHSRAAEYARDDPARLRSFFSRTTALLFASGVLPLALVAAFGPSLIGLVFGSRWTPAGALAAVMTPWALGQLSVSPVSRVVFVVRGQRIKLLNDVVNLLIVCGVFLTAGNRRLPLKQTLAVLSGAQVLIYTMYFLLMRVAIDRFNRVRPTPSNLPDDPQLLGASPSTDASQGPVRPEA